LREAIQNISLSELTEIPTNNMYRMSDISLYLAPILGYSLRFNNTKLYRYHR